MPDQRGSPEQVHRRETGPEAEKGRQLRKSGMSVALAASPNHLLRYTQRNLKDREIDAMASTPLVIADYGYYRTDMSGNPRVPTAAEIDQDLQILSGKANAIRLYTVSDDAPYIVQQAAKYGLKVIPSAYLNNPYAPDKRERTFSDLVQTGNANYQQLNGLAKLLSTADLSNIPFVVVGNEAISLVGAWTESTVRQAIQYVKSGGDPANPAPVPAGIKFTTAEMWYSQYYNADTNSATTLGNAVDVIFPIILPYWEPGVQSIENAVPFTLDIYITNSETLTLRPKT